MSSRSPIAIGLLIVLFICINAPAKDFYVAVNGNDAADGTIDSPFATLNRAIEAVREYKQKNGWPDGGMTVWIRGGEYVIDSTIEFDDRDSGVKDAPLVCKAFGKEKVSFLGGVRFDYPVSQPHSCRYVTLRRV